ncbi:MAG TPA: carboxymuconolactone decarboxylase family protein [Acidimicrobiia bacterium]|nr:carboxymuconolactone decarboxylase family protein [Acidimicrobiia bacterium]
MPFIKPVEEGEAEGRVAELFEAERTRKGYVPNYLSLFALRPEVYDAWAKLIGSIRDNMDLRRYELATLAAAQALSSSYCSLAHGLVLKEKFFDEAELTNVVNGEASEDIDKAVMALARNVAIDASRITEADIAPLRQLGLADADIFDVVLAAAARAFFSKTLDGTGTEPDREYRDLLGSGLSDRLAVGRPIEA